MKDISERAWIILDSSIIPTIPIKANRIPTSDVSSEEVEEAILEQMERYCFMSKDVLQSCLKTNLAKIDVGIYKYLSYRDREIDRYLSSLAIPSNPEVLAHLHTFFSNFYVEGILTPKTTTVIDQEAKLQWLHQDCYYVQALPYLKDVGVYDKKGVKVRIELVTATQGSSGDVKETKENQRFFFPVECELENSTYTLKLSYQNDPAYDGSLTPKKYQQELNQKMESLWIPLVEHEILLSQHPTKAKPTRTLFGKLIDSYTLKSTTMFDYFIHKDLEGFLRRELDFYIKNEIMRLDDIENADLPSVESYLSIIRAVRRVAHDIIQFLAQLENFQKKLWLKKKFVVETNYCITLDRIPEKFYPEIAANDAQREEWVKLFSIDEIAGDLTNPGYTAPLTIDFLKANTNLVLDTQFFDDGFKAELIASIQDFDEQCDGLLVHSENFQALNTVKERLSSQVSYIYIDPPYNTNEASFIYKNEYKHSSWGSMVGNSIIAGQKLLGKNGVISISIDDLEQPFLASICDGIFGMERRLGTLVVEIKPSGRTNDNFFATSHEYLLFYGINAAGANICFFQLTDEQKAQYSENDGNGAFKWRDFLRTGGYSTPEERPNSFYPIYFNEETGDITLKEKEGYTKILPIDSEGRCRVWRKTPPSFLEHLKVKEINIAKNRSGQLKVQIIDRIKTGTRPKSVWIGKQYDAASHGTKLLKQIFGDTSPFTFPKSVHAVYDCIYVVAGNPDCEHIILDYFAGSGTTGHAVIDMNRTDGGNRKYVLVEMGHYFDTVIRPRICKVVYSDSWKSGKPTARDTGISHCFKYIRIESYEDSLNNLCFDQNPHQKKAVAANSELQKDYILNYMLDIETKGSASLLNIDAFNEPKEYKLKVKKTGSEEYVVRNVDLLETFNYLIGLRVNHIDKSQRFDAKFARMPDPDLPADSKNTRLVIDGKLHRTAEGKWWFRNVTGWVPEDPMNPNNGQQEKVLIIWRNLTGNLEQDNLMLDQWFEKMRIDPKKFEYDVIYVNGSNNLPNLKRDDETWKVRLLEEEFMKRMYDT